MGDAKRIEVKPITAQDARRLVRQWHYSGKVVNNSQVHLGAFLDGKCGGGTIYRAAGFVLTGINANKSILEMPDGFRFSQPTVCAQGAKGGEKVRQRIKDTVLKKGKHILDDGGAGIRKWLDAGAHYIEGHQLRYVYFLHPEERANLTVPVLPFSAIDDAGARMYKGQKRPPDRGDLANEARRCEPDPDAPDIEQGHSHGP